MAIARKPKASEKQAKEQSINALINKGGSVAEEEQTINESGDKANFNSDSRRSLKKN